MESSKIKELAQDQQDYVVAMRREFHRSPELSGAENEKSNNRYTGN